MHICLGGPGVHGRSPSSGFGHIGNGALTVPYRPDESRQIPGCCGGIGQIPTLQPLSSTRGDPRLLASTIAGSCPASGGGVQPWVACPKPVKRRMRMRLQGKGLH